MGSQWDALSALGALAAAWLLLRGTWGVARAVYVYLLPQVRRGNAWLRAQGAWAGKGPGVLPRRSGWGLLGGGGGGRVTGDRWVGTLPPSQGSGQGTHGSKRGKGWCDQGRGVTKSPTWYRWQEQVAERSQVMGRQGEGASGHVCTAQRPCAEPGCPGPGAHG